MNIPNRPTETDLETINRLRTELAACQAERSDDKKYIEELCADLCKMEDALGFKHDCTDKDGAFVPTIGPWLERVRDLIAAEGELGDVKAERNAAQAAAAEMRKFINDWVCGCGTIDHDAFLEAKNHALSTSRGTGYVSAAELGKAKSIITRLIRTPYRGTENEFYDAVKDGKEWLEALKGGKA